MKPVLLDLFCGAGGAAMGYHRAGFEVVGVDSAPQPRYPFTFVQGDALTFDLSGFHAIHASPPCQAFSTLKSARPGDYPDLIAPVLARLRGSGVPWIVENVKAAPLNANVMLCGSSFGLGSHGRYLRRHRYFATSFPVNALVPPCQHRGQALGVFGHTSLTTTRPNGKPRGYQGSNAERAEAMGIGWMNRDEIAEAIPPAYTEWLGAHLREVVG